MYYWIGTSTDGKKTKVYDDQTWTEKKPSTVGFLFRPLCVGSKEDLQRYIELNKKYEKLNSKSKFKEMKPIIDEMKNIELKGTEFQN